jgi:hypothetical protein
LAQQVLNGPAQPGVHRAPVDLNNGTLLEWLDEPCPSYDWGGEEQAADASRRRAPDASGTPEFANA